MALQKIDTPAAYMMHDLGPQRFHTAPARGRRWASSGLGGRVMARMALHGLDARDAHLWEDGARARLSTDAGALEIEDPTLDAHVDDLDRLFASVAAGIAQERMARLAGWRPGRELPLWTVTASDVLVRRLREKGLSPALLWNTGVNIAEDGWIDRPSFCVEEGGYAGYDARSTLAAGSYVARYGTGMHLAWDDGELGYDENIGGATLTLPTWMLRTDVASDILDRPLGSVLPRKSELTHALAGYVVTGIVAKPPRSDAIVPEPHLTELHLAVPMRTLKDIPEDVILRAGIDIPIGTDRDRPLWMLTAPETLLRYRPRRA